jgi:hypothetical protein
MSHHEQPGTAAAQAHPSDDQHVPPGPRRPRLPSRWATALLAAGMLGIGVGVGAAIGPAPESSFAGNASELVRRLPVLISALAGRTSSQQAAATAPPAAPAPTPTPSASAAVAAPVASSTAAAPSASEGSGESPGESTSPSSGSGTKSTSKLPAITNVWLIQLSGGTFSGAAAAPPAAPYIDTQLIPAATYLSEWSTLDGSAAASEAALAAPTSTGGPPPLLHSIVQPPCPEGNSACADETPGQLTAADEFLKATLAQITGTATYREHGLVVVTFATVGIAAQQSLPEGASIATLTSSPPAGVVLLSPFARAGAHVTTAFNPTSPVRSLEELLH